MKLSRIAVWFCCFGALSACTAASEMPDGRAGSGAACNPATDPLCMPGVNAPLGGQGAAGTLGGAATGGTGAAGTGNMAMPGTPLPCNVQTVVASGCQTCHGATPIGGAPMSLRTHEDFARDYTVVTTAGMIGQRMKMYELVRIRINAELGTSPMPQGTPLAAADLATLNAWIAAQAPAATAMNGCGAGNAGTGGMSAGTGGMGGVGGMGTVSTDEWLPPQPGETCYELLNHGGQTAGDTTKYSVAPGENYEQFYHRVPWTAEARGTRFGTRFDNPAVLHHWLLYTSSKAASLDGSHETVVGTVIGDSGATLLAGWAVGGQPSLNMPDNVEFELPAPGTLLNAQWHFWNSMNTPQQDGSAILICTVPPGTREHMATVTWLGTENFNGPSGMPPGFMGDFNGTCPNDSTEPIHIFDVTPHMHQLGRHMRATVIRSGGTMEEEVFDMPFDFNYQINYPVDITLMPGDRIRTYCTFHNDTDGSVAFGPSSTQEMCYLFANSYPAGALENGVFSLAGATNTCW